jgi:hypothetical protein
MHAKNKNKNKNFLLSLDTLSKISHALPYTRAGFLNNNFELSISLFLHKVYLLLSLMDGCWSAPLNSVEEGQEDPGCQPDYQTAYQIRLVS